MITFNLRRQVDLSAIITGLEMFLGKMKFFCLTKQCVYQRVFWGIASDEE